MPSNNTGYGRGPGDRVVFIYQFATWRPAIGRREICLGIPLTEER
jgi:hypothetical protein